MTTHSKAGCVIKILTAHFGARGFQSSFTLIFNSFCLSTSQVTDTSWQDKSSLFLYGLLCLEFFYFWEGG